VRATVKTSGQIDGFLLNLSEIYDIAGHRTFVLSTSLYSTARTLLEKQTAFSYSRNYGPLMEPKIHHKNSHQPATEAHIK
jgi:hypothetical protein